MFQCAGCGQPATPDGLYCRFCGRTLDSVTTQTMVAAAGNPATGVSPVRNLSNGIPQRFEPGTVVANRYQIVRLAGRGGMGEVYCAYDMKLTQLIALKFLPIEAAQDPVALERLHTEVRLARQVSHPNVCRVYDAGEFEHQTFLSMEYIDGEDLSSLLRRIGRLPVDKGVEIARKLCAGLAAAHSRNVLHCDLKPNNVLIDREGEVLVTDFGLATLRHDGPGSGVAAGTPAYMAPEQFSGGESSIRTDLYSLGLVLYEMFTGRRLYDVHSVAELRRLHESLPPNPSSLVPEIDAATERAILWCLEPNPRHRPPSALAVAAALPGGDPLAAAIAAGETPSPELIAAAGGAVRINAAPALILFSTTLVLLLVAAFISPQTTIPGNASLEYPPAVLAQKGREIAAEFGYPDRPLDRAYGFCYSRIYLRARQIAGPESAQWVGMYLRYREAPDYLAAQRFFADGMVVGWAAGYDPPRFRSGTIDLNLDSQGRLLAFDAVPPEVDRPGSGARPVDWDSVLRRAGLDPAQFKPAAPHRNPPAPFDSRMSWLGTDPARSTAVLRVEAAAWRGKIVHFNIIPPWSAPSRMSPITSTGAQQVQAISSWLLGVAVVFAGVLLVRRHLTAGRGDLRGATRIAGFIFTLELLMFVLASHHVPTEHEITLLTMAVAWGLLKGAAVWIVYVALEPFVRRFWPEILISWSRVLSGRLSDSRVGRDLLIGLCLGSTAFLISRAGVYWNMLHGAIAGRDVILESFLGGPYVIAVLMFALSTAVMITFIPFLGVFLLKLLVKNQYSAAGLFILIVAPLMSFTSRAPLVTTLIAAVGILIFVFALLRFGLLAALASNFTLLLLRLFPLTTDLTSWHLSISAVPLLVLSGLAAYAWRSARRPAIA
jgi:serine/threonine-protein kinase